jgi:hypothetical protein
MTLLQRRAWNVLLANAYDELPTEEEYSMLVKDLIQVLEFDSKNEHYLKEALKALTTCGVEWNVLDKDNTHEWGVTTLLSHARIRGGVCTYSYSLPLRQGLHNPRMYARISLSIQNKFESKHAQALWELCVDYLDESRNYGETPFISLGQYRRLMGISEGQYSRFKDLNNYVIKHPVGEINRVTDFHVEVDYQRQSRKVVALKFKVRRELTLAHDDNRQRSLFPVLDDMPTVVRLLEDAGLSASDAWEIFQQGFEYINVDKRPTDIDDNHETAFDQYIREKIHLLKIQEPGKVKNRTGWLLRAIKQNYSNPIFAEEEAKQAQSQAAHAARIRERQGKTLEEEKERLVQERDKAIHVICAPILADKPELADEVIQAVIEADPHYRRLYERHQTALENYQGHRFLALVVDEQLVKRFPKRFKVVNDNYKAKLAEIDQQLAALG